MAHGNYSEADHPRDSATGRYAGKPPAAEQPGALSGDTQPSVTDGDLASLLNRARDEDDRELTVLCVIAQGWDGDPDVRAEVIELIDSPLQRFPSATRAALRAMTPAEARARCARVIARG